MQDGGLSQKERRLLAVLEDGPTDAHGAGMRCGQRAHRARQWAEQGLRSLAARGYVQRDGNVWRLRS